MKVFCLFWTLILHVATIEQYSLCTWSVEPAQNSTNIMTEFGFTKINGTCKWVKIVKSKFYLFAIDLYNQENSTDDYVSMAVYFREDVSGFPFHSQNVSAIYKHMINGKMVKQFADINIKILAVIQGHSLTIVQRNGDKIKMLLLQELFQPLPIAVQSPPIVIVQSPPIVQSRPPASNTIKAPQFELSQALFVIFLLKACIVFITANLLYNKNRLPQTLLFTLIAWEMALGIIFFQYNNLIGKGGFAVFNFLFQLYFMFAMVFLMGLSLVIEQNNVIKSRSQRDISQIKIVAKFVLCPFIWFYIYFFNIKLIIVLFSLVPIVQILENFIWKQKQKTYISVLMFYWINLLICLYPIGCPANILKYQVNNSLCWLIIIVGLIQTGVLWLQNKKIPKQKLETIKSAGAQNINPAGLKSQ